MRKRLLPSLLLLPLCTWAQTQGKEASVPKHLESLVNDRFEATRCPGLSVAVAFHNQIVFSKALGKADVEQDLPLAITSVQRLASLSKPITGTIIMDLVEQGKLSLDASVRQYLPELPAFYQSVTVRELLSHQSGVRGYADEEDVLFGTVHYSRSRDALKVMMTFPLAFTPGTKVEYSSLAFAVLGAAAEAVTGSSFPQLSMDFFSKHSIRGFALDDPYAIVPRRVRGYLVDRTLNLQFNDGRVVGRDYLKGTNGEITNAHYYDISNRYPAGGFDASAEDLLRFVIAVGSGQVLKPDTVDAMWTGQRTSDGAPTVFGLGWGVSKWKEKTEMVGMNGLELSTAAFLRYLPDSGSGVVLLCNAEGAKGLPELLDDILDDTVPHTSTR
jgi:CubicO group peptidase (beta-lactamase class C family)